MNAVFITKREADLAIFALFVAFWVLVAWWAAVWGRSVWLALIFGLLLSPLIWAIVLLILGRAPQPAEAGRRAGPLPAPQPGQADPPLRAAAVAARVDMPDNLFAEGPERDFEAEPAQTPAAQNLAADASGSEPAKTTPLKAGMEMCETCGVPVAIAASTCPACGAPTTRAQLAASVRRTIGWIMILWMILGWPISFVSIYVPRMTASPELVMHVENVTVVGMLVLRSIAADAALIWAAGIALIGVFWLVLPRD